MENMAHKCRIRQQQRFGSMMLRWRRWRGSGEYSVINKSVEHLVTMDDSAGPFPAVTAS